MKYLVLFLLFFPMFSMHAQSSKKLIWEENFDGNSLSMKNWNYENGNGCPDVCGWGNHEREFYRPQNLEVKNGKLIITAEKVGDKYFSARINTKDKFDFKYGTAEIRAKIPGGKGIWPAIWMLGDNIGEVGWPAAGEIDIMEFVGRQPDSIHTTLHTPATFGDHASTKVTRVPHVNEGFHVYKIQWSKDKIVFFIDDQKVHTYSPSQKDAQTYPFNHKFYFLLNMAIGGDFGGPEVDDSIFPRKFIVDYIKVYQ